MPLIDDARQFVSENIEAMFHRCRLEGLQALKLHDVLKRKNPYLFKAKNLINAEDMVKSLVDAHLSSQEETVFGGFLEQIAIFCAARSVGGRKSGIDGVDLEFERDGVLHLVNIKSGPNWHNKSSLQKLRGDFIRARKTLQSNAKPRPVRFLNGCCYGRAYTNYGDFEKVCGETFWTLISGEPRLFVELVEPLGYEAKRHNDAFEQRYAQVRTGFTKQFIDQFCDPADFSIDWEKIVRMNSGTRPPKAALVPKRTKSTLRKVVK
jgi:Type II restriction endonuclease EcoO109I